MYLQRCIVKLLLMLLVASGSAGADTPRRVVSTNLCTDQLLLMLAEPGQIASVSHLAVEPESSYMAAEARNHPLNHAEVEELLTLKPDLILAGAFTRKATVNLLRDLGYRVEVFPLTDNIEAIKQNMERMARLLGQQAKGKMLIDDMERRIASVKTSAPSHRLPALFYQPRGYTSGTNTLHDEALKLTGWRNVATEHGVAGYGVIDLESVLLAEPVQFFTSNYGQGSDSLAQRQLHHPALRMITGGRPMINIGFRYWICGGPMIADAIEQLAEIRNR
ncbi:MAG: ABC transporter substrate-binding protein [Candidatus Sedimenticola sp. 20ELBAFRAG]